MAAFFSSPIGIRKSAEYAWDRYREIDPEREWIVKLRERGGYVASSEKFKEAMDRHKTVTNEP